MIGLGVLPLLRPVATVPTPWAHHALVLRGPCPSPSRALAPDPSSRMGPGCLPGRTVWGVGMQAGSVHRAVHAGGGGWTLVQEAPGHRHLAFGLRSGPRTARTFSMSGVRHFFFFYLEMVKIQKELILSIQNERHLWNFIISYFSYFREITFGLLKAENDQFCFHFRKATVCWFFFFMMSPLDFLLTWLGQ